MDSFNEIWELVQDELKGCVTEVAYNVWLSPLEFVDFKNDKVYLSISDFKKKIIIDKFSHVVSLAFENVLGFPVEIEYVVPNELIKENVSQSITNEYDYTFDNFIIGPSNKFAHAAAFNVATKPGKAYNPLFIYGHSGLGKTHLLTAIMNEIKSHNPNANIIYTSGEHFTNELVYYIGNHNTHDFHEKYRNCDVLLVDDIQFIAKGETTQEEFFHTFNALNSNGSQIVLTSDRPPKEMMILEERLRTRFEMGLIADIQPPTLETRMAIVKKKAEDLNLELNDEVIKFIAENIKKNIRQLEGIVKKIKAYEDVETTKPTVAVAKKAISDIINDNQPLPVTVENIINEVSRTFDVTPADIRSDKRNSNISLARQVAIYVVDQVTGLSLKAIGNEFGNKHHSTIIYALKEIKIKLEKDIALKNTVEEIIKNINDQ
ncbi:MAG: chromosomal replication initiator protein DnaA [Clostridia bacterium]|nr:chromosomal replication initiator protein DnaA [Clostridia bacterium]